MLSSWFYPNPTGDVGRDRNARTLQFSCLLFGSALGVIAVLDMATGQPVPLPILLAAVGLFAAAAMNRAGRSMWAGRTAVLILMLGAILLVFEAHDGLRSHAMLVFPGVLLISVMLLDRASYLTTAFIVLLAVAALGIAEKHGLTQAIPGNLINPYIFPGKFLEAGIYAYGSPTRRARATKRGSLWMPSKAGSCFR